MTFFQAIIIGLMQGITELFPISSLGHSVLLSDLFGWHNLLKLQSSGESFFLSFLVVLHVATATALLIFYRREWVKIVGGFFKSVRTRKIETAYQKLAWLIIMATIPAGLTGLIFEHFLREQFAKPMAAAVFLIVNSLILFYGEKVRRAKHDRSDFSMETTAKNTSKIGTGRAAIIGTAQVGALFAGISRSGITMVSGLMSGLDYEDSARFSFLLATPIIFAAGLYKLPDFFGPLADGVRPQILAGGLAAGIAAYFSVRFLDKYFKSKSLKPFAIYCLLFGLFMIGFQILHQ
ncbi:MAG: undecaprenyl-diphosphate phosphatase [Candidatus Saccharimonadales bacterium]